MRIRKGIYLGEGVKGTSPRKRSSVYHLKSKVLKKIKKRKSKVLQSNPRGEGRGLTFLPYWPSLRPLPRSETEKEIELRSLALLTLLWGSPDGKEVERGMAAGGAAGTRLASAERAALQRYLGSSPCPGVRELLILVDGF